MTNNTTLKASKAANVDLTKRLAAAEKRCDLLIESIHRLITKGTPPAAEATVQVEASSKPSVEDVIAWLIQAIKDHWGETLEPKGIISHVVTWPPDTLVNMVNEKYFSSHKEFDTIDDKESVAGFAMDIVNAIG